MENRSGFAEKDVVPTELPRAGPGQGSKIKFSEWMKTNDKSGGDASKAWAKKNDKSGGVSMAKPTTFQPLSTEAVLDNANEYTAQSQTGQYNKINSDHEGEPGSLLSFSQNPVSYGQEAPLHYLSSSMPPISPMQPTQA